MWDKVTNQNAAAAAVMSDSVKKQHVLIWTEEVGTAIAAE